MEEEFYGQSLMLRSSFLQMLIYSSDSNLTEPQPEMEKNLKKLRAGENNLAPRGEIPFKLIRNREVMQSFASVTVIRLSALHFCTATRIDRKLATR